MATAVGPGKTQRQIAFQNPLPLDDDVPHISVVTCNFFVRDLPPLPPPRASPTCPPTHPISLYPSGAPPL
jgi:hypothetical protein